MANTVAVAEKDPMQVAVRLHAEKAPAEMGAPAKTWLEAKSGHFVINWKGKAEDNDWVALYANPGNPDDQYLTSQWQWAIKGTSYETSTKVEDNYQARYLRWQGVGKGYRAIAKSEPYKS